MLEIVVDKIITPKGGKEEQLWKDLSAAWTKDLHKRQGWTMGQNTLARDEGGSRIYTQEGSRGQVETFRTQEDNQAGDPWGKDMGPKTRGELLSKQNNKSQDT